MLHAPTTLLLLGWTFTTQNFHFPEESRQSFFVFDQVKTYRDPVLFGHLGEKDTGKLRWL